MNCFACQPSATAAMTDAIPLPFELPSVCRKKLTVDFGGGNQSSDAGLLLLRDAERRLGVCRRLAPAMPDQRDRDRILPEMFEMVMARSCAMPADTRMRSTAIGCTV
jgi:Transposase DDE domain group 1